MKQNFENIVRDSVNNHEIPYENGAWETFQKNVAKTAPFYTSKWFLAMAFIAFIGTIAIVILDTKKEENKIESKIISPIFSEEKGNIALQSNQKIEAKETTVENILEAIEPAVSIKKPKTFKVEESITPAQKKKSKNPKKPKEEKGRIHIEKQKKTITKLPPVEKSAAKANFYLPKSICMGETIYLTSEENEIAHSYEWRMNNKTVLKGSIQKFTANSAGFETISLFVLNEDGIVLAEQTQSIEIKKLPNLTLEFENDEFTVKNNYNFEIINSENGAIFWDLGDGTKSNEREVSHSYQKAGIYNVICKTTSEDGCSNSVSKKLEISGIYNFRKDYGFSPNGDNVNDVFIPIELKNLDVNFTMNIYARSGQLLYSSNSLQNPWNGMLANGTRCSFGSYVWVVTLTNEYGNEEVYKGTVTNVSN